jgi:voltage-gated potassium channel Kch
MEIFRDAFGEEILSYEFGQQEEAHREQCEAVIKYLNEAIEGARAVGDEVLSVKLSRALVVFCYPANRMLEDTQEIGEYYATHNGWEED